MRYNSDYSYLDTPRCEFTVGSATIVTGLSFLIVVLHVLLTNNMYMQKKLATRDIPIFGVRKTRCSEGGRIMLKENPFIDISLHLILIVER